MGDVLVDKLLKLADSEKTEEKDSEEAIFNRTESFREILRSESKASNLNSKIAIAQEPNYILIGNIVPSHVNRCRELVCIPNRKPVPSNNSCKEFTLIGKIKLDERNYSRDLIIRSNPSDIFDLNIRAPNNSVCIDENMASPLFPSVPPNSAIAS